MTFLARPRLRPVGLLLLATAAGLPMQGQSTSGTNSTDLYSMNIESLLNLQVSTASKFSEDLSNAPGVIFVVTSDELRRFGGMTVMEVLERVPGLFYSTDSFTDRSIISFRGDQSATNSKHVLYLINGRPTREVLEGGIATDLLEGFPVEALERIEVIEGPGSVLYGSNAFSGVVNLITRKPDGNNFVLNGMSAGGPFAATSGRFSIETGGLSISGAGQYHAEPDWPVQYQSSIYGNSEITVHDRSDGAFLDVNYKGLRLMSAWDEYRTGYVEGIPGDERWRRGFADLGYSHAVRPNWDMNFNLTWTRTTLDASESVPFITRDSYELVAEWTNTMRLGMHDRLTFGYAWNHMAGVQLSSLPPYTPMVDGSQSGNALYAQIEHQFRPNLSLVGGLQGNKVGDLHFDMVPRAGIIWTPAPHWTGKALYSGAYHAPMLHETLLNYNPPPGVIGPEMRGDPHLKAEKIETADLAITWRRQAFEAMVDYFHSNMQNRIVLGPNSTGLIWLYTNQGPVSFDGIQLAGKYYFGKHFFITASVIGQRNRDAAGPNVTPIPDIAGKAGLSYEADHGLTWGIFDVAQGAIPGLAGALNPQPIAYNLVTANFRMPLSKRFLHSSQPGVALVAHGDNLLNRPIWLPDFPDFPTDTIFTQRGRTVYVGVEFAIHRY